MTETPTRLKTLIALSNVFKGITIAHGFQHNLDDFEDRGAIKERVFRGRAFFGDDDPVPMVVVLENPNADFSAVVSPRGSGVSAMPWDLLIQGFVQDDKDHPTDPAHLLMADCKKALIAERVKGQRQGFDPMRPGAMGNTLLGMNGVVDDIKIGGGVVRPPDETSAKAYFWLPVRLDMAEDISNPFA